MIQEQLLSHDDIGNLVVNGSAEENDPLFQQKRIDVVCALAASRRLNHHRNNILKIWNIHNLSHFLLGDFLIVDLDLLPEPVFLDAPAFVVLPDLSEPFLGPFEDLAFPVST